MNSQINDVRLAKNFRSKPQTFMFGAVGAQPIQIALAFSLDKILAIYYNSSGITNL